MPLSKAGVSVIICCYNSSSRLPETLNYLALQEVNAAISWEIILVNNASSDDTERVAANEWNKYQIRNVPFNIVNQPISGLSFAREKGVEEAQYECLVFCDDDNWLCKGYVENSFKLLEAWVEAGIIGGCGLPKPELDPPEWFNKYNTYYATGCQNNYSGKIEGNNPSVYGAGAVIRKSVLLRLKEMNFKTVATDRLNEKLSSGGDVELCYAIKLLGYEIAFSEKLKFYHFIPENRLSKSYLLKLVYQFGYCDILHRPYYWLFNPAIPTFKKTWIWTLLISINIYLISLTKFVITTGSLNSFICKVNLKHSKGRLWAVLKLNKHVEVSYLMISNKFKKSAGR